MKYLYSILVITVLLSACGKDGAGSSGNVKIDGAKYPTVKIGTQTWTASNYNGTDGANYSDSQTNNPQHGKLYTYKEAIAVKLPSGWRLPTAVDFNRLYHFLNEDPKNLLSTTEWNSNMGTNGSGFNAFPTGYKSFGFYDSKGDATSFHTTTFNDATHLEMCFLLISYSGRVSSPTTNIINGENDRISIRFIKND